MSRILTNSGLWFDFKNPQPDQISLHDIAHALSRICRFGGHTYKHYSVAQHSTIVSHLLAEHGPLIELHGLLHDAHEAYTGDIVTPLKDMLLGIRAVEVAIDGAIRQAFSIPAIPWPLRNVIRDIDKFTYELERGSGLTYSDPVFPEINNKIIPMDAETAYKAFLNRFDYLIGEI